MKVKDTYDLFPLFSTKVNLPVESDVASARWQANNDALTIAKNNISEAKIIIFMYLRIQLVSIPKQN